MASSKGSLQAGGKLGSGAKDGFHVVSLLFCPLVFPFKPKMAPQLLLVGKILQELKVLAGSGRGQLALSPSTLAFGVQAVGVQTALEFFSDLVAWPCDVFTSLLKSFASKFFLLTFLS